MCWHRVSVASSIVRDSWRSVAVSVAGAAEELHSRLRVLSRRASLINRAIALCVCAACWSRWSSLRCSSVRRCASISRMPIAVAFVIALLSLAAALVYFLREVFIATASTDVSAG